MNKQAEQVTIDTKLLFLELSLLIGVVVTRSRQFVLQDECS